MNNAVPKQFIELKGKPVLMHTLEKFFNAIPEIKIILVLADQLNDEWGILCKKYNFTIPLTLTNGGETRYQSVKNGLALVPENCIVGVHDAARPLITEQLIINLFETAKQKGNACPAIPVTETIREVIDGNNRSVDRTNYFIIQTPQCFHSSLLKKAFLKPYQSTFTDDASVLEAMGEKINLIEGDRENIKITTSQDLIIAEALLER
ncbi:MAG: 2-C-methyl-D-erythritol 4-phosphate cytidylyltransferase [Bacteroidetes bacterium RIFCSPLOWO2_12_FULL_35_15]|nr:MAG: 2-C-methyl-D-erythritol 4-phosphate cytidylyltransferase [Bacteroidetes bacterium RIFCSPLOWO2_12_FULL_35_15]